MSAASTRSSPPHPGHFSASTSHTRRNRSAHVALRAGLTDEVDSIRVEAGSEIGGEGTTSQRSGDADDSTAKYLTKLRRGTGTKAAYLSINAGSENHACVPAIERGRRV